MIEVLCFFLELLSVFMPKIVMVKCLKIRITIFSFDAYTFFSSENVMITEGVAEIGL